MIQVISTHNAPAAIGPYSQAIKTGSVIYTSGQLGIDTATGNLAEGGITAQTHQAFRNLIAILEAAGASLNQVVKTTVFLADMADFAAMNGVYAEYFQEPFPARSTIAVKSLPKNGLVEIEAVAVL
ncbi:MAG: RidA family protein [Dysgonamonadaceae bacterium]|jgi:2-iminobutanoate/2-iminopropanoate deaminase|nr:RidA family protein [Dysgonamonadaceae bacterium]